MARSKQNKKLHKLQVQAERDKKREAVFEYAQAYVKPPKRMLSFKPMICTHCNQEMPWVEWYRHTRSVRESAVFEARRRYHVVEHKILDSDPMKGSVVHMYNSIYHRDRNTECYFVSVPESQVFVRDNVNREAQRLIDAGLLTRKLEK